MGGGTSYGLSMHRDKLGGEVTKGEVLALKRLRARRELRRGRFWVPQPGTKALRVVGTAPGKFDCRVQ